MTLATTAASVTYTGDGSNTNFDFAFRIDSADDVTVTLTTIADSVTEVLDPALYSVTGLGLDAGGSVTYPLVGSPLTSATKLTVQRIVSEVQATALSTQTAFYPEVVEDALDYLTMQVQQLQDIANRTLYYPVGVQVQSIEDFFQDFANLDTAVTEAQASATSAAASAATAETDAASLGRLLGVPSTSSVSIATGAKSFTIGTGFGFVVGSFVQIISATGSGANYMLGQVTSYSGGVLATNITKVGGSGTHADWTVINSGAPGSDGSGTITGLTANQIAIAGSATSITVSVGLSDGQILVGQSAGAPQAASISGDVSLSDTGVTAVVSIPATATMTSLLHTAIAAPSTPASGKGKVYVDSTSKALAVKNDAGTVSHTVQTKASVSHNFLTAIADDGTVSAAQPAFSDLSGNISTGQMNSGTGADSSHYWRGDGTWAVPPGGVTSKTISFTRVNSTASGSVAYTGVGFTPTALIINGTVNSSPLISHVNGMVDSSKAGVCTGIVIDLTNGATGEISATTAIAIYENAGVSSGQTAVVASYDADGFTLTWTKVGSPTGTSRFTVICLK